MFQKMYDEAGALCYGGPMLSSNMSKTEAEHSFDRLRRQETARRNRRTAGYGMFYRKDRTFRHA